MTAKIWVSWIHEASSVVWLVEIESNSYYLYILVSGSVLEHRIPFPYGSLQNFKQAQSHPYASDDDLVPWTKWLQCDTASARLPTKNAIPTGVMCIMIPDAVGQSEDIVGNTCPMLNVASTFCWWFWITASTCEVSNSLVGTVVCHSFVHDVVVFPDLLTSHWVSLNVIECQRSVSHGLTLIQLIPMYYTHQVWIPTRAMTTDVNIG